LKKSPTPKKNVPLSIPIWHSFLLAAFLAFFSCKHQTPKQANIEPAKKPQAINFNENSLAQPKIVRITASNRPEIVRAGKPIIKMDSLNGGTPFFTNYSTEQGLALSAVTCSVSDKDGNLWFGTQGGGVSRYDGKKFTNYTTLNGLAGNSIYSILQDRSGNFWFATDGEGISMYDGKRFTNYTKKQGLASDQVWCILQDIQGNIWFGTAAGATKYDGSLFTNYSMPQGLAGGDIRCLIQDRAGDIWIGTNGGGISRYNGNNFTNYTTAQGLPGSNVRCMIQVGSGDFWFGTNAGATRYDGKKFINYTIKDGLGSDDIRSMMQDKTGNIWFGTNGGGISKYDGKKFTNYSKTLGLIGNEIRSITQDRSGNIWFCADDGGISRYDGSSFTSFTTSQGLVGNDVWSMLQNKTGDIWFGADEGLSIYNGKYFMNYTTAQGLKRNNIYCIIQDKSGNIWFSTEGAGVSKFDGENFINYTAAQGLADNEVWSILQDRSGDIWFGSRGSVSRFNGTSFASYKDIRGLSGYDIRCIIQDKSGNLWFGSQGGGAVKFDGNSFTDYTTEQGLAGNNIRTVMQDRAGNIWFGTNGQGLSRFDGKYFTTYTTTTGLADNVIYAIVEDSLRHFIWIGTNMGLSGLRLGASHNDKSNQFEIFNKNTGYPIKDLNTNSLFMDKSGVLWAGCGDDRVIKFDYSALNKSPGPLTLKIQNIKVNNENICWNNLAHSAKMGIPADSLSMLNEMTTTFGKVLPAADLYSMRKEYDGIRFDSISSFYPVPVNLVLPYADNNLSFDFTAIEPAMPKQVRYEYKLEGYDKDWNRQGNATTAIFGNIPEGSYTFKLRSLSPHGALSETEYKFKVLPPWYRSWWAFLIYAVFFIATIWSFIYYRSKQLRRDNRILEEKVNLRTSQLKEEKEKVESALSELKSTQSQLIQAEKMASLGELTAGIAHEIQNPLNFVNNFSELNKELADELRQEIDKGNYADAKSIASDIKENEEKINHHGKRADAIVKGMLQHSRSSTGVKEAIDINALADEYLRLAYHGLRAKDKDFNATINTDFDSSIGKVNVIPQDIGRVLLNLYNNAFYAVSEKKKQNVEGYEPTVSVSSKKINDKVEIRVKDNGNGIPQKVVGKIFQPFFTTKPTGQGTGLGLSLSYDIVKAHGGEIKVETKEGEGSEFLIELPLTKTS
jgi:signal transduction histidine kinase/ligand-binding sensor domain-containing protein